MTRLLRGNFRDLKKAQEWFERYLLLREKNDLDNVHRKMESSRTPWRTDKMPHAAEVLKYADIIFDEDKWRSAKGDLLWYESLAWDPAGLLKDVGWDKYLEFQKALLERRLAVLNKLSGEQDRIVKITLIYDLEGSGFSSYNKEFSKLNQRDVAPLLIGTSIESGKRVYFINTPWWFLKIFDSGVKKLIPAQTLAKFRFLGTDYLQNEEFLKDVGATMIAQLRSARRETPHSSDLDASQGEKKIVPPGKVIEKPLQISKGQRITWEFVIGDPGEVEDKTEVRGPMGNIMDITFGKATELEFAVVVFPEPQSSEPAQNDEPGQEMSEYEMTTLVEPQTYSADSGVTVKGEAHAPCNGMALVTWSNTRCWIRSKLLARWQVLAID